MTEPLTDEGGEETGVPGENPGDELLPPPPQKKKKCTHPSE